MLPGIGVFRVSPAGDRRSPWAVKRLMPRGDPNYQMTVSKRLRDEADVLRKLQQPNIVGFRAFFKAKDGRECLALEECQRSLADVIEESKETSDPCGPFPIENVQMVAAELGTALRYIHNVARLLHGDIKSANVLINGKSQA